MRKLHHVVLAGIFSVLLGCATQPASSAKIDRISPEALAQMTRPPVPTLSEADLVGLAQAGKTAEEIIAQIKASDSQYDLTPSEYLTLNQEGVPNAVLDYMHRAHQLAVSNRLADEINQREQAKQAAVAKLNQQLQQARQLQRTPFCQFTPFYGYGAFGHFPRSHFGMGYPLGSPWYCW